MRVSKPAAKILALALSASLFSNIAFADQNTAHLWSERQNKLKEISSDPLPILMASAAMPVLNNPSVLITPSSSKEPSRVLIKQHSSEAVERLSRFVPRQYGSVRDITLPKGKIKRTVIHIQDVHLNDEAQSNIGGLVSELLAGGRVRVIGLEGTFGPLDIASLRAFPDKDIAKETSDLLLSWKRITGPIHAAITAPQAENLTVIGVDDRDHYAANVDAYRSSEKLKAPYKKDLAAMAARLNEEKSRSFNKDLAALDAAVQQYRDGTLDVGGFVKTLTAAVPNHSPAIALFMKAHEMETALDFKKVESERAALLKKLVQTVSAAQVEKLAQQAIAFRTGQITNTEFYQALQSLCSSKNVSLSEYPAMDAYIRYVITADRINAEELYVGLNQLQNDATAALTKTPEEKTLVKKSDHLYLLGRLFDFGLTPDEWVLYRSAFRENRPAEFKQLATFENFYAEAEARNKALTSHLLSAMSRQNVDAAILVTGGFHSPGVNALLKETNTAVITVSPKITQVDANGESKYLSVFTQEKTPLQNLFDGQKLFLGQDPLPFSSVVDWSATAAAKGVLAGTLNIDAIRVAFLKATGWTVEALEKTTLGFDLTLTAEREGRQETRTLSIPVDGDGEVGQAELAGTKVLSPLRALLRWNSIPSLLRWTILIPIELVIRILETIEEAMHVVGLGFVNIDWSKTSFSGEDAGVKSKSDALSLHTIAGTLAAPLTWLVLSVSSFIGFITANTLGEVHLMVWVVGIPSLGMVLAHIADIPNPKSDGYRLFLFARRILDLATNGYSLINRDGTIHRPTLVDANSPLFLEIVTDLIVSGASWAKVRNRFEEMKEPYIEATAYYLIQTARMGPKEARRQALVDFETLLQNLTTGNYDRVKQLAEIAYAAKRALIPQSPPPGDVDPENMAPARVEVLKAVGIQVSRESNRDEETLALLTGLLRYDSQNPGAGLLANAVVEKNIPANRTLIVEGQAEESPDVFIIISGRLRGSTLSGNNFMRVPGDMVGEMALANNNVRNATLETDVETKVVRIKADAFKAFLKSPESLLAYGKVMAAKRAEDNRGKSSSSILIEPLKPSVVIEGSQGLSYLRDGLALLQAQGDAADQNQIAIYQALIRYFEKNPEQLPTQPLTLSRDSLVTEEGKFGLDVFITLTPGLERLVDGQPGVSVNPGSIIGELSLLKDGVRSATIKVTGPQAKVFKISGDLFLRLFQDPEFSKAYKALVTSRTNGASAALTASPESQAPPSRINALAAFILSVYKRIVAYFYFRSVLKGAFSITEFRRLHAEPAGYGVYHNTLHSINVAKMAEDVARANGYPEDNIRLLSQIALLHDIDPPSFPELNQLSNGQFKERAEGTPARVPVTLLWLQQNFTSGFNLSKRFGWTERELKIAKAVIQRTEFPFGTSHPNPAYNGTSPYEVMKKLLLEIEGPADRALAHTLGALLSEYADKASFYSLPGDQKLPFDAAVSSVEGLINEFDRAAEVNGKAKWANYVSLHTENFLLAIGRNNPFAVDIQLAADLGLPEFNLPEIDGVYANVPWNLAIFKSNLAGFRAFYAALIPHWEDIEKNKLSKDQLKPIIDRATKAGRLAAKAALSLAPKPRSFFTRFVAAVAIHILTPVRNFLTKYFDQPVDSLLRSPQSSRKDDTEVPSADPKREKELKTLALNFVQLAEALAENPARANEPLEQIFATGNVGPALQSFYKQGGFTAAANGAFKIAEISKAVDEVLAGRVQTGEISLHQIQKVLMKLGMLGIPTTELQKLIGERKLVLNVTGFDMEWVVRLKQALPKNQIALIYGNEDQAAITGPITGIAGFELWPQTNPTVIETQDEAGQPQRIISLSQLNNAIDGYLIRRADTAAKRKAEQDNLALGFQDGVTFDNQGLLPENVVDQIMTLRINGLIGNMIPMTMSEFVEFARKLAIQA